MNKEFLSKRLNITRQTLNNWEKTKPELLRLINLGIKSDKLYLKFFELFSTYNEDGIIEMDERFAYFYFSFLNHVRFKFNVSPFRDKLKTQETLFTSAILYLMSTDKEKLFDFSLEKNNHNIIGYFARNDFQKPIFIENNDLSEYILRNTLDDFQSLLQDIVLKEDNGQQSFYSALLIAVQYLIYKFEPSLSYFEKDEKLSEIFNNSLGICAVRLDNKMDIEKVFKKYLKFRDEYSQEHIHQIKDELDNYQNNYFYVPNFISKLEK